MPSTQKKSLPVYCIGHFQEYHDKSHFDIQPLEHLLKSFRFAQAPHRHDFYDILIITKGSGIHTIDAVEYPIKPCSLFFLTPGQVHALDLSSDAEGYSIFFDDEFYLMKRGKLLTFPFFHSHSPELRVDCKKLNDLEYLLEDMLSENERKLPDYENIIRIELELFMRKIARLYVHKQPELPSSYFINLMDEFNKVLEENFMQTREVNFYADQLHVTPKNLTAIAKKVHGKTTRELIQTRVILEAKRMLLYSDLNMTAIAHMLNLYDSSYFVKFFKKATGITPQQFRKRSRK